jgi:hypothetical protein
MRHPDDQAFMDPEGRAYGVLEVPVEPYGQGCRATYPHRCPLFRQTFQRTACLGPEDQTACPWFIGFAGGVLCGWDEA